MKKGNILSIAQKAVRDSGLTNMWQSKVVQYWAFQMGFYELVTWMEKENNRHYATHMISTNYYAVPSVNTEMLLELGSTEQAREMVVEMFEKEIKEYEGGFYKMETIPFTMEEFKSKNISLIGYLSDYGEHHAMEYIFDPLFMNGQEFVLFKDGFYRFKGKGGNDILPVTEETWKEIESKRHRFSDEDESKYQIIDKKTRLKRLFAV